MEYEQFEKATWEEYPIDVDFANKMPATATNISSATYSAERYTWTAPNTRTSDDTIFVSTTASIVDNTKARVEVTGGTSGQVYDIYCKATLDDGSKVEHMIVMICNDNAAT